MPLPLGYITGRSTRTQSTSKDLTGTIEDTAEEVTSRGGVGIAVRCDHTVEEDVQALYAQIKQEQGKFLPGAKTRSPD
jgi:NAD(P)-dependent dehydrogenase (short-subunit alcohol dehydrogenase family)